MAVPLSATFVRLLDGLHLLPLRFQAYGQSATSRSGSAHYASSVEDALFGLLRNNAAC